LGEGKEVKATRRPLPSHKKAKSEGSERCIIDSRGVQRRKTEESYRNKDKKVPGNRMGVVAEAVVSGRDEKHSPSAQGREHTGKFVTKKNRKDDQKKGSTRAAER